MYVNSNEMFFGKGPKFPLNIKKKKIVRLSVRRGLSLLMPKR